MPPSQPKSFKGSSTKAYNGSQNLDHADISFKEKDSKPKTSFPQTPAEKQQDFAGIGLGAESTWHKR
ncbi:hypothetical protein ASPWEDRAFT_175218 [Aspergillus wentii DTO 134E9]|uniref:Uncharacterized protein n=1 Tax=Aspergillus wentii DTO 134E9 TaxID=1073089 RepID=A0A1L9RAG9_ASPWE|nr:uncharacterized protein ASPWEDRAFT_175218 [Aspergillus wentii DTO 134E9]KAI9934489.1 hypothetical protein MW887_000103 [Aspergillus wentii]OJJ31898.1 hypothetical protein ASPWEDRAFT_175218 [Aspergillus wentii DTO 134E9]